MRGQILGNRYELIEKVGGGGMAEVYKAKCQLLNRFVAVKILRLEFINDDEFVKRFRVEAQSAASLSHPNIVSIYDVGREDDIHYIVMEYIDGLTLKSYLEEKKGLNWREAVNISVQICSALEHAHKKKIIHRDIKSHNIMLTKEGVSKVTDFGIARAVSASTVTIVGSTMGSVHYFSPEQARGGFTDEKSDIYSLGIVLYELVTGKLPFDGDTPVAVALKHLQETPQEPITINNDIPDGLNSIIMNAIEKEQMKRYQSSAEMMEDLRLVLKEPNKKFQICEDLDSGCTRRMPVIGVNEDNDEIEDDILKKTGKKDKLSIWMAIATSLVIMAIFIYITIKAIMPALFGGTLDEFEMQSYIGQSYYEIERKLLDKGLQVIKNESYNDIVEAGQIISQSVDEGTRLRGSQYTIVEFEVSKGERLIEVPDLTQYDYRQAEFILHDLGFEPEIKAEFSETLGVGVVIRTQPTKNQKLKPSSKVIIYMSKGPEERLTQVPNLVGKTKNEALNLLSGANLTVGTIYPRDTSNMADYILRQEPIASTEVMEGTPIDLFFDVKEEITLEEYYN